MKRMESMIVVVAILVAVFGGFVASASAGLSDSWDLGDISGAYWTSSETITNSGGSFIWTQLGSNINCQHQIDSVSAQFSPLYFRGTQHGYQINEYISGRISSSLTAADVGPNQTQQNSVNARGLYLSEFSGLFGYDSSSDPNAPDLREQGGANVALRDFIVDNSYASYYEYTGGERGLVSAAGGESDTTCFSYNITWQGDFLPGTLDSGFVASGISATVPEPATLALLGFGALGVIIRRRNRR